ncbi:sensor histidine kinase [Frigoribacterium salinisoli]
MSQLAPPPAADHDVDPEVRRPLTRRDHRVDAFVASALTALGLGTIALGTEAHAVSGRDVATLPVSIACLVALVVPVALRRRRPVLALVLVSAAFLGGQALGYPDVLTPAVAEFLVIYTANAWAASRRSALVASAAAAAVLFACFGAVFAVEALRTADEVGGVRPASAVVAVVLVSNALYFATAIAFGRATRVSAQRLQALEQAGVELRAAQELVAEQAIVEERSRIARELHDVVGHHVASIGIQAGAARRVLDQPDVAREALAAVETTTRATMDELARLLLLLRDRDGDRATLRGPADVHALPELVRSTRALGLDVRLDVSGAERPLPESVGITLYRVAQEALTNTLKHAGARSAVVALRYEERSVSVEVDDDGHGGRLPSGAGLGHRGMRERVDLHGGALEVGPGPTGGFRVLAVLPLAPARPVAAGDPVGAPS